MKQAQRDLITYPVLILSMAFLLVNARGIPDSVFEPVGGRFLAQLVPALIIVLSIAGLVQNRITGWNSDGKSVGAVRMTIQLFGLLFFYALGLTVGGGLAGFTIVSAVFVVVMAWILFERDRPKTSEMLVVAVLAVGLPLAIGLVFTRLLFVNLP